MRGNPDVDTFPAAVVVASAIGLAILFAAALLGVVA